MATILYARVSTSEQTIEHQRTQAEKAGFKFDKVVWDEGVSGVSTKLAKRPQGRRPFDLLRSGDTLVVRWLDRLGRNYQDICDTIREFMQRGVVIRTVINGITFDGATMHSAPAMVLTTSKRNLMRLHFNQMSRSLQLRYGGHDFRPGSSLTSLKGVLQRFFAKSER
jgi:DNA invertase Pin-like site-specific DNA recombinase